MGKLTFEDVKGVIDYNNSKAQTGYTFPMMSKLNKIIGNIQRGQVHTISGLPSAGVTSFIDQNYVMSVLLQWYNTDPSERKYLKILYYSMKDSELKKLQLLLCNYLKLVENLRTDIPTLNNQKGKLYDLSADPILQKAIDDSTNFFDEVISSGTLEIKDGQYKPTEIYNDVLDIVADLGSEGSDKRFVYDDKHSDGLVLVVVDPVEYFLPDNDGFGTLVGKQLHEKFQRQIRHLKIEYDISFVLAVPSETGYIRTPKDTEPHYRHLGSYGSITDKGIIIYNPIAENNTKFYDGEEDLYVTNKGNILMRTWHVVRNTDGIESVRDRMVFLPGTSYMVEYPFSDKITDIGDILNVLEKDTYFKS